MNNDKKINLLSDDDRGEDIKEEKKKRNQYLGFAIVLEDGAVATYIQGEIKVYFRADKSVLAPGCYRKRNTTYSN